PGNRNLCPASFNRAGDERHAEQRTHEADREPLHRLSPIRTSAAVLQPMIDPLQSILRLNDFWSFSGVFLNCV
ncbi:hypothetical protein, partial [Mesorhizobium sp. M00.F.Ca.ET.220.01.1.1]|uniref:hypothetical protein n=1 Tax=Mesorhizobium sp. M00.F.Ca.ET.220.01.1.1 TaxID=2500531 RepID=UPI001AEDEE5C